VYIHNVRVYQYTRHHIEEGHNYSVNRREKSAYADEKAYTFLSGSLWIAVPCCHLSALICTLNYSLGALYAFVSHLVWRNGVWELSFVRSIRRIILSRCATLLKGHWRYKTDIAECHFIKHKSRTRAFSVISEAM
jgi:hypothetical protein